MIRVTDAWTRQQARAIRRAPWYAGTIVGVVALTVTLSTTVFAIVDGVLFKPLPHPDADRLYTASGRRANGRGGSVLSFDEIRAWQRDLADVPIAGFQRTQDAGTLGDGVVYGASMVDEHFFDVLGQRPLIGGFAPEHFDAGSPPVAIVSHRMWRQNLGGTIDAIGRELPLAGAIDSVGRPVPRPVVVGVLPPDFVHPTGELPDILRPSALSAADRAGRNQSAATGLIRLPRGKTIAEVEVRLDEAIGRAQPADRPERSRLTGASVRPLDDLGATYRRSFRQLAGVSATLVLLACVAIATLASGRARQQERQALIRRALGATSWDLFRHSVAEASLLTAIGSAVGISLAPMCLTMTLALMPVQAAFVKAPAIDIRVAALAGLVLFVTTIVIALASVSSSRRAMLLAATAGGATPRVRRAGRVLIATQTALAFVLTLGGTLGFASLWRAWATDPGYDPAGLVLVEVNVRTSNARDIPVQLARLNDEFAGLPGVSSAGMFGGRFLRGSWTVATVQAQPGAAEVELQLVGAGSAFFDVLDLRAQEGRLPTRDELLRGDDVVVLSERAARTLWPDGPAVGRTMLLGQSSTRTVIGIVPEPQFTGLASRPAEAGQIYTTSGGRRDTTFLLKTSGSSAAAVAEARRVVASAGGQVDLIRAMTMREALADSIKGRRLAAWLHGGFAGSALLIVGTAILGLVAMSTGMRTREFGIRQALGARRDRLVAMLLREQMVTVVTGLTAGAVAAYWSLGLLRGAVADITPTDARLWLITAATILFAAVLGMSIPAVRSTRADPVVSLRVE